jgi:hypothetical protein
MLRSAVRRGSSGSPCTYLSCEVEMSASPLTVKIRFEDGTIWATELHDLELVDTSARVELVAA